MTLRGSYADYLMRGARRDDAGTLGEALADKLHFESQALLRFASHGAGCFDMPSPLASLSRVFIGPLLPDAEPGSLWFDTVELSAMVLLKAYIWPDERDDLSPEALEHAAGQNVWCSLRPVSRFQFGAFVDVAPIERARFAIADAANGDECKAVSGITCGQAGAYLYWFGKSFASRTEHLAAAEQLGLTLWSEPAREWVGESTFNDAYYVAITPSTLTVNPRDTEDTTDPAMRMLYGRNEVLGDVTFRSAVPCQWGLTTANVASRGGSHNVGGTFARSP